MSFRIRVAAIASAVTVAAIGAGYLLTTGTAGAAEPALDKVKATVQKALGSNVEIKSVAKSPLAGLYEINLGSQVVYTDATGRYVLNELPAGTLEVVVTYTGLDTQRATVTLAAGQVAVRDFEMSSNVLMLDTFKVTSEKAGLSSALTQQQK